MYTKCWALAAGSSYTAQCRIRAAAAVDRTVWMLAAAWPNLRGPYGSSAAAQWRWTAVRGAALAAACSPARDSY